jgi:hypothetical protein
MKFALVLAGLSALGSIAGATTNCVAAFPINGNKIMMTRVLSVESESDSERIWSVSDQVRPETLKTLSDLKINLKEVSPLPIDQSRTKLAPKLYPAYSGQIEKHGDGPNPATITIILAADQPIENSWPNFKGLMIIDDPGIAQPPVALTCSKQTPLEED